MSAVLDRFSKADVRGEFGYLLAPDGVLVPPELPVLMGRYREAARRFLDANEAKADLGVEMEVSYRIASHHLHIAITMLLGYRPKTLAEVQDRLAFLVARDGPWSASLPLEWEFNLFVKSMLPEHS